MREEEEIRIDEAREEWVVLKSATRKTYKRRNNPVIAPRKSSRTQARRGWLHPCRGKLHLLLIKSSPLVWIMYQ